MNHPDFYFILLSVLLISPQLHVVRSYESVTIYDLLKSYHLPRGLFPKGVKDFSFDDSGTFQVYLDQPCNSMYENELHYDRNVSGVLTPGKIDQLSGISARDLFLWFQVQEIRVDIPSSGLIYFDVGVVSKQFSLSSFETPKECLAVQLSDSRGFIEQPAAAYKSSDGNFRYQLHHKDLARAIL
ncbi:Nuclear transition protein like [Heracleum sosnowskyi]|uniref:Nuclear transition protein like n=1 Tax=Heracleum sosnowskyi TaxID=360622 RepID=A0AAD8LWF9_9APIA|nr:Nuclear transition protein like [Heracleum sosnowskyi]